MIKSFFNFFLPKNYRLQKLLRVPLSEWAWGLKLLQKPDWTGFEGIVVVAVSGPQKLPALQSFRVFVSTGGRMGGGRVALELGLVGFWKLLSVLD
jgi:hypothetical protein